MRQPGQITLLAVATGCAAILILAGATAAGQDPAVTLQRAIQIETVDGDLNAAIEHYKQVIKSNGGNRSVAARALLRLGGCYEKLGQEEARKTYQQLVSEYADQQQEVKLARQRLTALAKVTEAVAAAPKFRRIQIPGKPPNRSGAILSPDGTRFAFVAEGGIWTVPVSGNVDPNIAGEPVRLTKDMGAWDNGNAGFTWSVDGSWIGFRGRPDDALYLVPSAGGEPQQVKGLGKIGAGAASYRVSISANDRTVAFVQWHKNQPHVFTVPAEGGTPKVLVEEPGAQPAFSPDGKLIAYVSSAARLDRAMVKPDSFKLSVVPAGGGTPVRFYDSAKGRPFSPLWSPDGTMLAFGVTAGAGEPDRAEVWIVAVSSEGRPAAEPTRFSVNHLVATTLNGKPAQKFVNPLGGWSSRNEIALLLDVPFDEAIYTVPAAGGRATRVALQGREPRWSPDGKRIYFRGETTNLASVAAGGGQEVSVEIRGKYRVVVGFPTGSNEVSRDGKSVVFSGFYRDSKEAPGGMHIFTVPSGGGDARQITPDAEQAGSPAWSPDGKSIAYIGYPLQAIATGDASAAILVVSTEGGPPRQLTSATDLVSRGTLRWSPDGKTIAYFGTDNTIRMIPAAGGTSRVLAKVPASSLGRFRGLSWSPDSSKLVYAAFKEVRVIPTSGGQSQLIGTGFNGAITQVDWSPDGRTFAFTGVTGGEEEIWLMSDFLHLVTARR